jgi:hypothetical protein
VTAAGSKFLTWGTLDGRLLEIVRVSSFESGLRAIGTIVRAARYGASYNLIVGTDGVVRRLSVRTESADGPRSLSLTRNPDGNWVSESNSGSSPMPSLAKAEDVYLRGSVFAACLPIIRTRLYQEVTTVSGIAADVHLPSLTVEPAEHHGTTTELSEQGARIHYTGAFGDRELLVDDEGYLISVEGLVQRLD